MPNFPKLLEQVHDKQSEKLLLINVQGWRWSNLCLSEYSFLHSRCSFEACWFVASQLLLVIDRKFFRL